MKQPDYWAQAITELAQQDEVMARLIVAYPHSVLTSRGQPFYTLVRSIVGQQISVKAADSIWARLVTLCPRITPKNIMNHSIDTLRTAGLSERKAQYIQHIAEYFLQNRVGAAYWARRTDEEVIHELTQIRGVGRWTAEMFLMFTLLRPNVFPVDDIGLLRGLEKNYDGERLTPKQAQLTYFERFSPWASVATWYLWRSLDPVEIHY